MDHRDILGGIVSPEAFLADHEICSTRRGLLVAPLLAALSLCRTRRRLPAQSIRRRRRLPFPARSSGTTGWPVCRRTAARWQHFTAALDKPGPYLVLMKWYPGYMSAPHTYATDRLSLVLSGTWWVNSGADFDPDNTVPVPAGGFVRRIARTPHYDGVKKDANEPAVIGLFGIAPVQFELVDLGKPGWRQL